MSNFNEKNGVVYCEAKWGRWYQTVEEIFMEIGWNELPRLTRKDVRCDIKIRDISLSILDKVIVHGKLSHPVLVDESFWTLEDGNFVCICLGKAEPKSEKAWELLLEEDGKVNEALYQKMQQKMMLEKLQKEEPGW